MKKIFFILKLLLIPAWFIIFLYGITLNEKEIFPSSGYLFEVIMELALAYISSVLFFYIVQYLPWKRMYKIYKDKILYQLLRLKFDTKNFILYMLDFSNYNYKQDILNYYSRIELPKTIKFDLQKKNNISLYVGSVCQYIDMPKIGIELSIACIRNSLNYLKEYSYYQDYKLIDILSDISNSELLESLEMGKRSDSLLKKVVDTRAYELNEFISYYRCLSKYIENHYNTTDMENINKKLKCSEEYKKTYINGLLGDLKANIKN